MFLFFLKQDINLLKCTWFTIQFTLNHLPKPSCVLHIRDLPKEKRKKKKQHRIINHYQTSYVLQSIFTRHKDKCIIGKKLLVREREVHTCVFVWMSVCVCQLSASVSKEFNCSSRWACVCLCVRASKRIFKEVAEKHSQSSRWQSVLKKRPSIVNRSRKGDFVCSCFLMMSNRFSSNTLKWKC